MDKLKIGELRELCHEKGLVKCGKTKKEIIQTLKDLEEPLSNEYEALVRENDPQLWIDIRPFVKTIPDIRGQETLAKMKKEKQNKWRLVYEELAALGREDGEAEAERLLVEAINKSAHLEVIANEKELIKRFFAKYPSLVHLFYETNWKPILSLALSIGDVSRLHDIMTGRDMKLKDKLESLNFIDSKETAKKVLKVLSWEEIPEAFHRRLNILMNEKKYFDPVDIRSAILNNNLDFLKNITLSDIKWNSEEIDNAVKMGRLSIIKYISTIIDLDDLITPPIVTALHHRQKEIFAWLLEREKMPLEDLLHLVVNTGRVDIAEIYLEKNLPDKVLIAMARKAARLGYDNIIFLSIDYLKDVSFKTLDKILQEALRYGRNEVVEKILLDYSNIIPEYYQSIYRLVIKQNLQM